MVKERKKARISARFQHGSELQAKTKRKQFLVI
jgi:hypothetical protein